MDTMTSLMETDRLGTHLRFREQVVVDDEREFLRFREASCMWKEPPIPSLKLKPWLRATTLSALVSRLAYQMIYGLLYDIAIEKMEDQ